MAIVEYTLVVASQNVEWLDPTTSRSEAQILSRLGTFVNGTSPGPTLEANLGDTVVVTVVNEMASSDLTIHFHGLHQPGTFYADGVHGVTQCDIPPHSSFVHRFTAWPVGTHMYHSHMPYQFGDGVFGAFIVHGHDALDDPYAEVVPKENEIILGFNDWMLYSSDHVYKFVSQLRFDQWPLAYHDSWINGHGKQDPLSFTVSSDETYRLRTWALGVEYGWRLYLTNHTFTVIAADGSWVEPQSADFIDLESGERYDLLFTTNQDSTVAYELRARVLDFRGHPTEHFVSAWIRYQQEGYRETGNVPILSTGEAVMGKYDETMASTYKLLDRNSLRAFRYDNGDFAAHYQPLPSLLVSDGPPWIYRTTSYKLREEPQVKFMEAWDFHMSQLPPTTPLIFDVLQSPLSDASTLEKQFQPYTRNITGYSYSNDQSNISGVVGPRVQALMLDQVIDIVFENAPTPENEEGLFDAVHPNHFHGHYVWVLGSGVGAFPRDLDMASIENLNLVDPPQRDTVVVPARGWTAVRLQASNPGVWLMHCHRETHAVFGMSTVFAVGSPNEMPRLPSDFPLCGSASHGRQGSLTSTIGSFALSNWAFSFILLTALVAGTALVGRIVVRCIVRSSRRRRKWEFLGVASSTNPYDVNDPAQGNDLEQSGSEWICNSWHKKK